MRTSTTGRPILGSRKTCECGRQAVVHKWGQANVCARCHAIETEMYTVGSKWERTNIVIEETKIHEEIKIATDSAPR